MFNPVSFSPAGMVNKTVTEGPQEGLTAPEGAVNKAGSYTIQPAVWMILFLAVGYIGLRWIMED